MACGGEPARPRIRVVSYNIRSGLSSSIDDIAAVLTQLDGDVVALQEVDRHVKRTRGEDQAALLARKLGYQYVYAATRTREGGDFGIAFLSRLPIARVERIEMRAPGALEPRVALDADLCVGNGVLHFVTGHLDVLPWSERNNADVLANAIRPWLGEGLVVAGDFNAPPTAAGPRKLMALGLEDSLRDHVKGATFQGLGPRQRIDYLFTDAAMSRRVLGGGTLETPASDHKPVFLDLDMAPLPGAAK
jgi:endonuclease/exonuclease/phosphatase family metal-dependent hydrolase